MRWIAVSLWVVLTAHVALAGTTVATVAEVDLEFGRSGITSQSFMALIPSN